MTKLLGTAALAWLALTLATPGLAAAQDAAALLRQGVAARRAGNDEAALDYFTRANAAQPSGVARAQMGLAAQALGRWVEAHDHLSAALATSDTFVTRNRATLEAALATVEQNVGRLELRGSVGGGRVEINGRDVGTMPLPGPITVALGETVIIVRLEGYHRFLRTIEVRAGAVAREEITLVPLEPEPVAAPPPEPVPVQPAPPVEVPPLASPAPVASPARVEVDRGSPSDGFLGAGVAFSVLTLAAAGVGIGFGVAFDTTNAFYESDECAGPIRERVCPRTLEARDANVAGAIASAIGGGASLVLAVVFYAVAGSSSASEAHASCVGGPGELGIACGARF
ncbi:MAG: PEGA domain-containing protein [Sandaracinaceae bacterium]|nr:PEGA domain-containing protein [Sandaracinaceae bacterium]